MISLIAPPTFKYIVDIPRPGDAPAPVDFEFKHRTKGDLTAFIAGLGDSGLSDDGLVMEIAVNWDGPDKAFSPEAVAALCENYPRAAVSIWEGYLEAFFNPKPRS